MTVREIDNRHFYWLDRARPQPPSAAGKANTFSWGTTQVLQRIAQPLEAMDHGVVGRVGRSEPSAEKRVLRAAMHGTVELTKVSRYLFTFKPCCLPGRLRGQPSQGSRLVAVSS